MIRKLLSVVAFVGAPLFLLAGVASAQDYVPAAVAANNSGSSAAPPAISGGGVVDASVPYTGSGINVSVIVFIGALIIVLGVGLCVAGARVSKRHSAQF